MIRRMQRADIDRVADIWLDTNIRVHNFISKQYWQNNFSIVKEMLSQSEIYVYEEKNEIQGFVGLSDKYIEGIFVSSKEQSKGDRQPFDVLCKKHQEPIKPERISKEYTSS